MGTIALSSALTSFRRLTERRARQAISPLKVQRLPQVSDDEIKNTAVATTRGANVIAALARMMIVVPVTSPEEPASDRHSRVSVKSTTSPKTAPNSTPPTVLMTR